MRLTTCGLAAAALVLGTTTANAQRAAAAAPASPLAPRPTLVSVNPLGLMFGMLSGEVDHAMSRNSSGAIAFSLWSPDGFSYASVDAKYKFLPSENGLEGFYIGPTAGFTHVGVDASELVDCTQDCAASANALTAGVELGYTWLIGVKQNFAIGTGLGAKKLFFVGEKNGNASGTIPTIKLNVGYAF